MNIFACLFFVRGRFFFINKNLSAKMFSVRPLFDYSPQFFRCTMNLSEKRAEYLMYFVYLISPFTAALFVIRVVCTFMFPHFLFSSHLLRVQIWMHLFKLHCIRWCWFAWIEFKSSSKKLNAMFLLTWWKCVICSDKKPKSMLCTLSFTFGGNFRHFSWITHHFWNYQLHKDKLLLFVLHIAIR